MKILMKPVDMVVHFDENGLSRPLRLRTFDPEGLPLVIKIVEVFSKSQESIGKEKWILYRCRCVLNDMSRSIELKFNCSSCVWYIYKF